MNLNGSNGNEAVRDHHALALAEEADGQNEALTVPVNGTSGQPKATQAEQPAAATSDYPMPPALADHRPFL